MPRVLLLATSVAVSPGRAVVELQALPDPTDDFEPHGNMLLTIPLDEGEDEGFDEFVQGEIYAVNFHKSSARKGTALAVHQSNHAAVNAAVRIPNSTNDPNYVTPPEQKLPPPVLPDGVVTEPRPSVVMPPAEGSAPPTAGVVSAGPVTAEEQAKAAAAAKAEAGKTAAK